MTVLIYKVKSTADNLGLVKLDYSAEHYLNMGWQECIYEEISKQQDSALTIHQIEY
jgi:hypothetical protein